MSLLQLNVLCEQCAYVRVYKGDSDPEKAEQCIAGAKDLLELLWFFLAVLFLEELLFVYVQALFSRY